MLQFVICISIVSLWGSMQASIVDNYLERISPSITMSKMRNIQLHSKRNPSSEEQYQRHLSNSHYYPGYDKGNYRRLRTINSKPVSIIFQPFQRKNPEFRTRNSEYTRDRPRIKWPVEKNIKRYAEFSKNQNIRSGNFFGKNNRRSFDFNVQNHFDEKNDFGKYVKDTQNNKLSRRDHSYLKRTPFKANPQNQERLKNYDNSNSYSTALKDYNGNFDEKDKFGVEYLQSSLTFNDSQDANRNDHLFSQPSGNKGKGLLLRKTSQVEYIIRNEQDSIDLLNKKMKGDIFSAIKNLQAQTATAIYESELYTEIVEMEPRKPLLNDEGNNLLKTLNELRKNVPNKSQGKSYPEINSPLEENYNAADLQKFRFTDDYYPGISDGVKNNVNENSKDANYEYEDELPEEDQNIPQSTISSEIPSIYNEKPQSGNEKAAFQYLKQSVDYGANNQDEYFEYRTNAAILDYELGKPSLKAHFVPSQPGMSESSPTTIPQNERHEVSETPFTSKAETKLAEISPGSVQVPSVLEDVPTRMNPIMLNIPESAAVSDVEAEPPAYESELVYNMKYPPVVPQTKETDTETNVTKRLMRIHSPHRMKSPEIRHRRKKQKVSRGGRSPINRDSVLKRRWKRQIDVEEAWNVPGGDCCHNGGTCFTSHHRRPQGIPSRWCECPPSFQGRFCEEDMNECALRPHPCKECETCVNEYGGFSCKCQPDFVREGDDCIPVVTCEEFPCLNGAECIDTENGHFRCTCPLGFVGRICDTSVEECEDASCSKKEICVSTETGFKCEKIDEVEAL